MQNTIQSPTQIGAVTRYAIDHPWRWFLPALLIVGLGFGYALIYQPTWEASQALTVRDEYSESDEWGGSFNEADQQKHAQETFLELARSPAVITTALQTVGPPTSYSAPNVWPQSEDVAKTQERVEVVAPNGTEFGTTHMFYLSVADPDRQRAVGLVTAICDASEECFRQLRDREIRDEIAELTNTITLAQQELDAATETLQKMETTAGGDLAELRMLSESFSGGTSLQATLSQLETELRQVENTYTANRQLLELLVAAQQDSAQLVATPNRLLEALPALRRLKEGLTDAQLNTSRLLGTMSNEHPRVRAALAAEGEIRGRLHHELEAAVRGMRAEQTLLETQLGSLTDKNTQLQQRLQRLATMRAPYSNHLAKVRQLTDTVSETQQTLNIKRAKLMAGDQIALITRVDLPQTGPYPNGPPRSLIAAAGCVGGLLVGLGIILLTLPVSNSTDNNGLTISSIEKGLPEREATRNECTPQETLPTATANSEPQKDFLQSDHPKPVIAAPSPATGPSLPPIRWPSSISVSDANVQSPETPAARRTTLKEALVRCAPTNESWK